MYIFSNLRHTSTERERVLYAGEGVTKRAVCETFDTICYHLVTKRAGSTSKRAATRGSAGQVVGGGGRWEVLHSEASVYRLNRHTTVYMKFNLYVLMP